MSSLPFATESDAGAKPRATPARALRDAPLCLARAACFPDDEECVQDLLLDYERVLLRMGVRMPGLGAELTSLPGLYASPRGAVYLAELDGRPVGCAALVAYDTPQRTAEIRRLHVSAAHAAPALDALLARSVAFAALLGCQAVRHTPLPDVHEHREAFARHRFMPAAPADAAEAPPGTLMPADLRVVPLTRSIAPALHRYFSTNARSIT